MSQRLQLSFQVSQKTGTQPPAPVAPRLLSEPAFCRHLVPVTMLTGGGRGSFGAPSPVPHALGRGSILSQPWPTLGPFVWLTAAPSLPFRWQPVPHAANGLPHPAQRADGSGLLVLRQAAPVYDIRMASTEPAAAITAGRSAGHHHEPGPPN